MKRERMGINFDESVNNVNSGFEELTKLAGRMGDQANWCEDYDGSDSVEVIDDTAFDPTDWHDDDFVGYDDDETIGKTNETIFDAVEVKDDGLVSEDETVANDDFVDFGVTNIASQEQNYEDEAEAKNDKIGVEEKIANDRETVQKIIDRLGGNVTEDEIADAIRTTYKDRFLMDLSDEVISEFGLRDAIGELVLNKHSVKDLCLEFGKDFLDKYGIRKQVVAGYLNSFDNILYRI